MLKNNIKTNKISLNILQIMKFGLHIGGWVKHSNVSAQPFIIGKKHRLLMLDTDNVLANVRRVIFLIRKITLKKEKLFLPSNNTKEIAQSKSVFNLSKKIKNGLLTNKQLTDKISISNKIKKEYLCKNSNFFSSKIKVNRKDINTKYKKIKLPSMAFFFKEENNKYGILETRKKKIISSVFLDSYCDISVTQYPILNNNNSLSSLKYFIKILNLSLNV